MQHLSTTSKIIEKDGITLENGSPEERPLSWWINESRDHVVPRGPKFELSMFLLFYLEGYSAESIQTKAGIYQNLP